MMNKSVSIDRLGIPSYNWWSEACHGVRQGGYTVYPQPIGMAAAFDAQMVRAVVGTLIDVGRGRISVEEFRQIVAEKKRTSAGESMPGHALYLVDVRYPFDAPAAADVLPDAGSLLAQPAVDAAPAFVPSPNAPLS